MPLTQYLDNQFWGVNATLDWVTAGGTFTLLPAYRESHLDTVGTALGVNVTTIEEDQQTSLEARFASGMEGRFSYIVGAYWFDEANDVSLFVPNTQYSISIQDYRTGVESTAAFGRLTYPLSESLRAVVSQSLLKKVGGGRVAAHEIMVGIPAIRNLIREDKVAQMYSSIQTGAAVGMQTLDQCLQDLVKRGLITRLQASSYAKDKKLFD